MDNFEWVAALETASASSTWTTRRRSARRNSARSGSARQLGRTRWSEGRELSADATPLLPESRGGLGDRLVRWGLSAAVRASLLFSPRPAAWLINRAFASGDGKLAAALEKHVPAGTEALVDERYGDEPDMLLDVARPAAANGPLPLLLWVHGGGFIGGSKDELRGFFKIVASDGYVVAGANYSLAPDHRYPTPPRQMMQALEYLQANAERAADRPGADRDRRRLRRRAHHGSNGCACDDARVRRCRRGRAHDHARATTRPRARLRPLRPGARPSGEHAGRPSVHPDRHVVVLRASATTSTIPPSQPFRSPTTSRQHSRRRSSPSGTPTRSGRTRSCSPRSCARRESRPRRSSSPTTSSRRSATSTSSTSTPTRDSSSSNACARSCGSGLAGRRRGLAFEAVDGPFGQLPGQR